MGGEDIMKYKINQYEAMQFASLGCTVEETCNGCKLCSVHTLVNLVLMLGSISV